MCDYTDPDELEQPAKKQRPAGAATAAGAAGGKKKGGQKELELEGRIQMLEDMLKLAVGAGVGNVVSGGGQQQMPLQQPPPSQQQQPQQSAGVLPGNVLHALQQPQQPFAVPPAFPSSAGGPADFFDLLPQTTTTAAADATATAAQAQIWSYESPSSGDMSLASGASVASGSSRSVPSLSAQPLSSANPSPGSGGAFSGGGEGLSNPTVDSMDSPDEYLTELLWPGCARRLRLRHAVVRGLTMTLALRRRQLATAPAASRPDGPPRDRVPQLDSDRARPARPGPLPRATVAPADAQPLPPPGSPARDGRRRVALHRVRDPRALLSMRVFSLPETLLDAQTPPFRPPESCR